MPVLEERIGAFYDSGHSSLVRAYGSRLLRGIANSYRVLGLIAILAVAGSGCGKSMLRMGSCAGGLTPPNVRDVRELGVHNESERNGMLYTCYGGFIDLAHVRNAVDTANEIMKGTRFAISNGEAEYIFKSSDYSRHHFAITYPNGWRDLPLSEREAIARDVSIQAGAYGAYYLTTFHEIKTYQGWKPFGIIPVFVSAFSFEDNYSNALGAIIGPRALKDREHPFDEAVTIILEEELIRLGAQPKNIAREGLDRIRGVWYKGGIYPFTDMIRRHLDIGLGDDMVKPWLVPGLCEDAKRYELSVPKLEDKYGLEIVYYITDSFVSGKLGRRLGRDLREIYPGRHFLAIMAYIREDAIRRYGVGADTPN